MVRSAQRLLCVLFLFALAPLAQAADARFDLTGPKIDVRVTRGGTTLDIAQVPNLQPGDKIWLHPDLPPTQSVKYLLICVFLRGNTNPPPDDWFVRIETWDKKVRTEGTFVTVPDEAQQVVLLLAPETGGDFSTLKSAVKGRPGIFVRADQDLIEAGFEQARIEKYLASIRRVPPSDADALQKHSDLLARTLNLKPNPDCFKRPPDTQFTCLTQTGTQTLLDDGHGNSIVTALSNGPGSDFINQASYTRVAGAGDYSAYVGAIIDLVRLTSSIHTAQYQYIPAIAFPQGAALNLRLNTPPSFHNPKSVLVIGMPAVQKAIPPPLRPADAEHVSCLLAPNVTLPIEGAPLVFSTSLAHDLVVHLDTPPGAPAEDDIPLVPDPYQGGLVLQHGPERHKELRDELKPVPVKIDTGVKATPEPPAAPPQPEPILLTGTIKGRWGFDDFVGPTVQLQQLPGDTWHIVNPDSASLIAGKSSQLLISSTGTACVHTISMGSDAKAHLDFKAQPHPDADKNTPLDLAVTLPADKERKPGDLHLEIQQYGQPKPDLLTTRTFTEPAHVSSVDLHAGDRSLTVTGTGLSAITKLNLGDLVFKPQTSNEGNSLRLALPPEAPASPTHADDHLTAIVTLNDGRTLKVPVVVSPARPAITLLSKTVEASADSNSMVGAAGQAHPDTTVVPEGKITLSDPNDLPLSLHLTFTIKSAGVFPRNGQIEVETLDGTLHATLTLAPAGGLLLQDPHTVVATLDPSRSFGASAFGALHLRAVFPPKPSKDNDTPQDPDPASDWLPLATIVRLPTLTSLTCAGDLTQPCTLIGSNFFLLESLATNPAFTDPTTVPDGFTGSQLTVPHPASGNTLFLKLRDDPNPINSVEVPLAAPHSHASTTHPGKTVAKS